MRRLIADVTVRGLAIANAPALFARLHQFDWYGGTLRGMIGGLHLSTGSAVLDVGCGPGELTCDLADMGHRMAGIDRSQAMIRRAQGLREKCNRTPLDRVNFMQADALNMPFENSTFDAVLAASLLNVVQDKHGLIVEMARVTKPNGRVIAIFPTPLLTKNNTRAFVKTHDLPAFQAAAMTTWASVSRKLHEQDVLSLFENAGLKSIRTQTALGGMLSSVTGAPK